MSKTLGIFVKKGATVALLYASDESLFPSAERVYSEALCFGESAPKKKPHIYFTVK